MWATGIQKFTEVHRLLVSIRVSILHPKENPKQACSFHALLSVPWNKTLGTLGSTLGQKKMSWAEQTGGPWSHQEQIDPGMLQADKLTSWSSGATPFNEGLGDCRDEPKDSEIRVGAPRAGDGSDCLFPFSKREKNIYPRFQELRVSPPFHHFALKLKIIIIIIFGGINLHLIILC